MPENPSDIINSGEPSVLKYFNIASQEKILKNAFLMDGDEEKSALDAIADAIPGLGGSDGGSEEPDQGQTDTLSAESRAAVSNLVLGNPNGCLTTPSILNDDTLVEIESLEKVYNVYYEPGVADEKAGYAKSDVSPEISIKNICNIMPEENINSNPKSPSKVAPALSAHLMQYPLISPQTKYSGAVQFFMNTVPPMEFSRCVPYIDLMIITKGGREKSGLNSMRFLGFGPGDDPSTITGRMNSAVPQVFVDQAVGASGDLDEGEGPLGTLKELAFGATENSEVDDILNTNAYTSMDIFTLPQSLVDYSDPTGLHPISEVEILDRSRPFMSLKSITISNLSQRQETIYTVQAKVDLVLHDRSRLADIAPLIAPKTFKSTRFLFEYGWSHPDGGLESDNIYGRFLNSMRSRGEYFLVRSDYSFTQDGQVNVSLVMQNASSLAFDAYDITQGYAVKAESIIQMYRDLITNLATNNMVSSAPETLPSAVLNTASTTALGQYLPASVANEIQQQIDAASTAGSEVSVEAVANSIDTILFEATPPDSGTPYDLAGMLDEKIRRLSLSPKNSSLDPFLKVPQNSDVDYSSFAAEFTDRTKYVSFGKLVLSMVGQPIAASRDYDEVQIHFHSFNSSAGAFWGENIASFPINLELFKDKVKEKYDETRRLTVLSFFDFLAGFLESSNAAPYGISRAVQPTESESTAASAEGSAAASDDQHITEEYLDSFMSDRIRNLGCPIAGEFIVPEIEDIAEVLNETASSSESSGPGKTVLRLSVIDTRQSPYLAEKVLLRSLTSNLPVVSNSSVSSGDAGTENNGQDLARATQTPTAAIEDVAESLEDGDVSVIRSTTSADRISSKISDRVPTFLYGSTNSAITSLDVRGTTTGDIADALIMDALLEERRRESTQSEEEGQGEDTSIPADLHLVPATLTLNTLGCPLLAFGQQYFLSMGTGTTLEQIYGITRLVHNISAGEFKSTATLYPLNSGRRESTRTSLQALRRIARSEIEDGS
jgi:hypothetical protein